MTGKRNDTGWRLVASRILVACCIVAMSGERARATEQNAPEARQVVAKVNGQPIYEDQLRREVDKNLSSMRKRGMRGNDAQVVKRLQLRILNKAIGDMLINQESKKRNIENMEEKVEQRVKDLEQKFGAGEGMERYLKIRGITMDGLKESLKGRVRVDEYLKEQGVLEPEISEERIRAMYDADPESFSAKETVTVSHILIAVDADAAAEEKDLARQKAEQIRKEVLDGKDFAAAAQEYSGCKSAANGGSLGRIKRGFMPAEFDKVAFALETGAVSEVAETTFGFHIIKLTDKDPGGVVPYEQMRDFLKKYLQDEESKKKLEAHIAQLRGAAQVEILLK